MDNDQYHYSTELQISSSQYLDEEKYWLNKLSGDFVKSCFPYDHSDTSIKTPSAVTDMSTMEFKLPGELFAKLKKITGDSDIRLHMTLTTALIALLWKYTGNNDILVGIPVYKQEIDAEFINTVLTLKNTVDERMTFKELLFQVRQDIIRSNANANYPIETLLYQLKMSTPGNVFPLFDTAVLLENIHDKRYLQHIHLNSIFSFLRKGKYLEVRIDYNPSVFKEAAIERIISHYRLLLQAALFNPDEQVDSLEILSEQERKQLIFEFNKTSAAYPKEKTLHMLFAEQAARTPGNTALVFEDKWLSYKELHRKSNQLVRVLKEKGAAPDTMVGIMIERSIEMIIGIFAVLKAGGAYLPISPKYPTNRVISILEDSQPAILLIDNNVLEYHSFSWLQDLSLNELKPTVTLEIKSIKNPNLETKIRKHFPGMWPGKQVGNPGFINMGQSTNLAYVIYTSGSTGKPKGVMIEHRSVVNRLNWMQKRYPIGKNDVILQKTPFTFDVSVWELFWWALQGASLCLLGPGDEKKPDAIIDAVEKNKITVIHFVPSMLNEFLEYIENTTDLSRLASLRQVFASGEALGIRQVEKFNRLLARRNKTKLANLYGPTEAAVDVTYFDCCAQEHYKKIPIGKPIDNIVLYIVDKNLQLQPIGSVGELCISGDGLARGYLNRLELTKEKFPANPFRPAANMYRTGDLVKWLPDGNIEFLGRKDHQVKIRGYRIELGEIESKLLTYPPVKEAAVVLRENNNSGDQILSAYVIPESTRAFAVRQLLRLEKQDIKSKHLHDEFPNGMTIFYINRKETEFMYKEIFTDDSYIKNGITLSHDDCIFDVGANIGLFSLYVNQICNSAKIYAFEPVPQVFELLSLNTSIYGKNIKVFNYGISSKEREAIFSYYPHATFLSGCFADREDETMVLKTFLTNEQSLEKNDEILSRQEIDEILEKRMYHTTIKCNLKTLSQVIKGNRVDKIDLLKIDVEKSEIEVLKGIYKEDWPKIRQLVIEVHDIDGRLKWITDLLNKQGYNVKVRQDKELKNTCLYNVYAISSQVTRGEAENQNISSASKGLNRWISPRQLVSDLKRFLKEDLPHYMVPANILLMDAMPLTPGGKIDRKSLPIIENPEVGENYVKPGNEVEKKLVEIWSDVLGIRKDRISIDANFFESGGHSLKAITVISRINKAFNVKIPLSDLFKSPTIRGLSGYLVYPKEDKSALIEPVEEKEYYMLSSAQKRMYILNKIEYLNTAYNVSEVMIVEGHVNKERFEEIFRKLIMRHEILRTSFKMMENEPIQKIHDNLGFEIEYYNLATEVTEDKEDTEDTKERITTKRHKKIQKEEEEKRGTSKTNLPMFDADKLCQRMMPTISEFIRPFDLAAAPLIRVGLIILQEEKHILMFDMHHIISDGTSINILVKEFMAFYKGEDLPGHRIQYKDFSHWQNTLFETGRIKKQEEYWLKQFEAEIPVLDLPADFARPAVQGFEGIIIKFGIDRKSTEALKTIALDQGTTLYMVLLTITNIFLSKISSQEDIVIGTPVAGRRHAELEDMIGMFVNTLALRNQPLGDKTFPRFLKEVKKNTLEAFENQDYPFKELVNTLANLTRDASRNPLFDVMFAFQNWEFTNIEIPGLTLKSYPFESGISKFDLTLQSIDREDRLEFSLEYCTSLFRKKTIQRFINYFKRIITAVVREPNVKIGELEIISGEEKRKVLYDVNDTETDYPKDKTLHELFAEQVERTPDHIAVIGEMQSAERRAKSIEQNMERLAPSNMRFMITYRELHEKSNQLAHLLNKKGVQSDTIVGIMVERSLEMFIWILGILKAGGAYLPIDPRYPAQRINYMLTDSRCNILLTSQEEIEKWNCMNKKIVHGQLSIVNYQLNSPLERGASSVGINGGGGVCQNLHLPPVPATSIVYIIYTSGTTGNPKGVVIQHASPVNFVYTLYNNYSRNFGPTDHCLSLTNFCFDVSVCEIFMPLVFGASIVLLSYDRLFYPEALARTIVNDSITFTYIPPGLLKDVYHHLKLYVSGFPPGLNKMLVGVEPIQDDVLENYLSLNPQLQIVNGYGPTEATICASAYRYQSHQPEGKRVPIGGPLANTKILLLDKTNHLAPVGIPGELCIFGAGLARGYLNRPESTAEKFYLRHPAGRLLKKLPRETSGAPRKNLLLERSDKDHMQLCKHLSMQLSPYHSPQYPITPSPHLPHSPMYRTCDLAKWLPDGNILFIGRIDRQVKIRGYRIEAGEIESRILEYRDIKEAVVTVQEPQKGDKYLCAYIVPKPGGEFDKKTSILKELKGYLSNSLPDYMIPSYFMQVKQIPLTPNGKIDMKALPALEIEAGEEYIAPRNEMETKIAGIWSEVLGIEKKVISIDSNFFQSGGHSLKAAIMASKIHKELKVELPLVEIFKTPTIRGLSGYIGQLENVKYTEIEPVEKREYFPLSSAQKRLYIVHQMKKDNIAYNSQGMMILEGELRVKRFEKTNRKLFDRHESLRTSFHMKDDTPVQRIHDQVEFEIEYYDSVNMQKGIGNKEELQVEPIIKKFIHAFDLSQAPLLRVGLIKVEPQKHILMVDMHHIVTDGTSQEIFAREFMTLYGNRGEELPALRLQYKDFSGWQTSDTQKQAIIKQEGYWKKQFAGEIPVLHLPTDHPRPAVQSFAGGRILFEIREQETTALNQLALVQGTSLYMVLLALYAVFLAKLTGQQDIVVGTPIAGRRHADLQQFIGMFVNTLGIRNYPDGEKTFSGFLQEVKEIILASFENQDYPFEDLVETVTVNRDAGRNPLFDVMFVLQNMDRTVFEIPGLKLIPYDYDNRTSKFDLTLDGVELENSLQFTFEYCTKLFKVETIERFTHYFRKIISSVLKDTGQKIGEIDIIPEPEKQLLLDEFNDTYARYPKDKTLHQLFEEQVKRTPDVAAVIGRGCKDDRINDNLNITLTYKELNHRANRLAYQLGLRGVSGNQVVGLMVDRSVDMVIGLYGILKLGGAYMPVAPDYPMERIRCMLEDSSSKWLVTQKKYIASTGFKGNTIDIESESLYPDQSQFEWQENINPGNLIYVIYTSGSTGKPRGVPIKTRGFINLVWWYISELKVDAGDKFLVISSISFDLTQKNLFAPLITGASLHLAPPGFMEYESLSGFIARERHTVINCAPPAFYPFVEFKRDNGYERLKPLRYVILGGEPIRMGKLLPWLSSGECCCEIYNSYGPTECTDVVSYYRLEKDKIGQDSVIPIGKPVNNMMLLVLDRIQQLQPLGVVGEVFIAGIGTGSGYCNNVELTAEKFIRTPNWHLPARRFYRTGDMGRLLADGNIEFLGRIDYQVKIRGFRIELREIEIRLLNHNDIKNAIVIPGENEKRGKYLCAYIISERGFEVSELREFLSKKLPDYMIPSSFIQVEKIPLTFNGKVDRKALASYGTVLHAEDEFMAPRNDVEMRIAELWEEVLQVEKVGIDENFFDLGGNSMDIIKLSVKYKKIFNEDDSLMKMFRFPTIRSFAQYLNRGRKGIRPQDNLIDPSVSVEKIKNRRANQKNKRREYNYV